MLTGKRLYGPKGFTQVPEVSAILDKYKGGGAGGIVRFDGVTVAELEKWWD